MIRQYYGIVKALDKSSQPLQLVVSVDHKGKI